MRNGHFITDYHCHSTVSPDGHNTMRGMAEAAVRLGVDDLCFTDHIEPLPWDRWNEPPKEKHSYDWAPMLAQFREAQEAVGDRIKLHMGAELGECSFAPDVADSFLDDAPPLDFTIGSVHCYRTASGEVNDLTWITSTDPAVWYAACESYFTGKKPKETEDILPYRQAFTALGINPNKFLCSIEALLTRIAKGKGFPHINAAVDLGNAVSIKHRLPMGAHDLDTIDEGLDVRLAREGDTFIPFGSTEEETPDVGEAVYASGSEIRTRRWTWRQSERGKITEATKAILFPIDGFSDVNAAEVQAAADELVALLHKYFGDSIEIETGTVTKDHPRFDFFL